MPTELDSELGKFLPKEILNYLKLNVKKKIFIFQYKNVKNIIILVSKFIFQHITLLIILNLIVHI